MRMCLATINRTKEIFEHQPTGSCCSLIHKIWHESSIMVSTGKTKA